MAEESASHLKHYPIRGLHGQSLRYNTIFKDNSKEKSFEKIVIKTGLVIHTEDINRLIYMINIPCV